MSGGVVIRHSVRIAVFSVCAVMAIVLAYFAGVAVGDDGTNTVKLVSLDYLDAFESDMKAYIDSGDTLALERIELLKERIAECEKNISDGIFQSGENGFKSITLATNQNLTFSLGCEIVAVSGSMMLTDGSVCDTSAGKMMDVGDELLQAHHCVATSDGVVTAASDEVIILIKGDYSNG